MIPKMGGFWLVFLYLFVGEVGNAQIAANSPKGSGFNEQRYCGVESLYIVFRTLGKGPDRLNRIIEEIGPAAPEGYSLQQLSDVCGRFEFFSLCVSCPKNPESLQQLLRHGEVILRLKKGHFVVCTSVENGKVVVTDVRTGTRRAAFSVFQEDWDGDCLIVSGSPIDIESLSDWV